MWILEWLCSHTLCVPFKPSDHELSCREKHANRLVSRSSKLVETFYLRHTALTTANGGSTSFQRSWIQIQYFSDLWVLIIRKPCITLFPFNSFLLICVGLSLKFQKTYFEVCVCNMMKLKETVLKYLTM